MKLLKNEKRSPCLLFLRRRKKIHHHHHFHFNNAFLLLTNCVWLVLVFRLLFSYFLSFCLRLYIFYYKFLYKLEFIWRYFKKRSWTFWYTIYNNLQFLYTRLWEIRWIRQILLNLDCIFYARHFSGEFCFEFLYYIFKLCLSF